MVAASPFVSDVPAAQALSTWFDACAAAGCRVVLFAPGPPWEMLLDEVRRRPDVALVTTGDGESFAERLRAALRGARA